MDRVEQYGPWVARVAWVALALVSGPSVGDALTGSSSLARTVAWLVLSVAWTAGMVALLVPRTTSLTAVRLVIPAGLAAAGFSAATGTSIGWSDWAALATASIATVAVLSPWFTETWVDGSSYGSEHRVPLQTPTLLAATAVPLTWLVAVVGAVTGPALLAHRQWGVGVIASVVGAVATRWAAMSLHQLSRRWLVLVPAGLVLHDPLSLAEPQLFPRMAVAAVGPALTDSTALDLTAGASGLVLQLDLTEPVDLLVRRRGRNTETVEAASVLFSPARPGPFLELARAHRLRVPS